MRVRIDDACTGCSLCCDASPEVFEMGCEIAEVSIDPIPTDQESQVQEAADECPVGAIVIE